MPSTTALTPFIPTLFRDVEERIRAVLALRGNVRVEYVHARSAADGGPAVSFRVHLPNGIGLDFELAQPGPGRKAWREGENALLSYKKRKDGTDPLTDPAFAPSLTAIGDLFLAVQKARGAEPGGALWETLARVDRYGQVDDYMYRQISNGTLGPTAYLRLGFKCSQDCWFCWQGRSWPDPPDEYYFTWLDEIAGEGVKHISFTGGEPTLHPALPDLVRIAKQQHGMQTMIQTNAIRFRHREFRRRMVEAGTDILFVSFHASDPDISDAMTRTRGTWSTTVKGIEGALADGIRVSLNCVVEQANYRTLGDHARFIIDRFVTPFPDNPAHPISYSMPAAYHDRETWEASMVPFDEVRPHVLEAARLLRDAGVYPEFMGTCGFPPCLFREDQGFIRLLEPGDKDKLDDMDRSARDYGPACSDCVIQDRCLGPRATYVERYGDRGLTPFEAVHRVASYRWGEDGKRYDVATLSELSASI